MDIRPTYVSRFEEPEGEIKTRLISSVGEEWRAEPGDFIYDAVVAPAAEIKQLQINQDTMLKSAFAQYAEDTDLDAKVAEQGIVRKQATPNKRGLFVTAQPGVVIPAGHIASQVILDGNGDPLEYSVDTEVTFTSTDQTGVMITCTTPGIIGNVPTDTEFIISNIPGINTITDGGTTTPGTDTETDAALYERYWFKVTHPDTGGNKYDFERWTMEVPGVGKCRIFPRKYGEGTVGVVLVGTDFKPASQLVVDTVQEYLDPGAQGLGEGKAPANARTTVTAATEKGLVIVANVIYSNEVIPSDVNDAFTLSLGAYLQSILFSTHPNVSYNHISALLTFTDGVIDHTGLTINGVTTDIVVTTEEVPVITSVTLTPV